MTQLTEMNVEYIKKLNKLNNANKKVYLKVSNSIKYKDSLSEIEKDSILIDILDHLIIAQNDGKTANEFFGDTDIFIKELVSELPRKSYKSKLFFIGFTSTMTLGILFIIFSFFDIVKLLSTGSQIKFPLFSILIIGLISVLIPHISIKIFEQCKSTNNKVYRFLAILIVPFIYIIYLLLLQVWKLGPLITIPSFLVLSIGVIFSLISYYFYKNYRLV